MKVIRSLSQINREEIYKFLFLNKNSSIYNDPRLIDIFEKSGQYTPVFIAVLDDHGAIVAYFIASVISERGGALKTVTSRCIAQGSVLYQNTEALKFLLKEFNKTVGSQIVYTKINNTHDASNVEAIYKEAGFYWEPHLNFLIDLGAGEEVVWKNIKSNAKQKIKAGQKKGLTFKISFEVPDLEELYHILKVTYDRAALPLSDILYFKHYYEAFSKTNQFLFVGVYVEEKLVGLRIVLLHNHNMHDWYAGALPDYYEYHPNDVAVWATLKWGIDNGYKLFDFGGGGHPDKPYGVRDFKRKFGGEEVNFGYYTKIFRPVTYKLIQKALSIYKSLKSSKKH